MNLNKCGKFIMNQRKKANLTQDSLAKMLNITAKAVSKWERGLSFPDTSILSPLSVILKCSISEILMGEQTNDKSSNIDISCNLPESYSVECPISEKIALSDKAEYVVSPYLFGENLEHTRNCIHSGLSAEMLENRKFAGKPGCYQGCASEWSPIGSKTFFMLDAPYTRHAEDYRMKRTLECNSQRITAFADNEISGIKQSGFTLESAKTYEFTIVAKSTEDVVLNITLLDENDNIITSGNVEFEKDKEYEEKTIMLDVKKSCDKSSLAITFSKACTVYIGALSLMKFGHFRGMRRDVIDALKQLGISILRWPGGNFAGEYNWKDGLLPRNMRAPLQSYLGLETQPHSMGYDFHEINTDDFVALCNEIGAEPYITINPVWNTPEESAQWVEYCNGDETTEYGKLRISRGFTEPYDVNFWSLGNEFGYGHMEGANTPHDYSRVVLHHAEAMLKVSPTLSLCSSGPYPNKEWVSYSAKVLRKKAPLVSLHKYINYPEFTDSCCYKQEYYKFLGGIDEAISAAKQMRNELDDDTLRISFDEWNSWYAWYRPESVCDGIFTALMLHRLIAESEKLGIDVVCHFESINEGSIRVTPTNVFITPMGQAFGLIANHSEGKLLYASQNAVASEKVMRLP